MERFDAWLTRSTTRKPLLRGWFAAVDDRLVAVDVERVRSVTATLKPD
jgi:hypothetical protein